MGLTLAKLWDNSTFTRDLRILMVGLDGAGKTTILYKLKLGDVQHTVPTIGFNVETVEYKNISFTVWDVGGQTRIRPLWRHYYKDVQGIIFVIDSNDVERLDEAKNEIDQMFNEPELKDAIWLVFANKQDLPKSLSTSEIAERLKLHERHGKKWHIQGCTAHTGDGLYQGLDWLTAPFRK